MKPIIIPKTPADSIKEISDVIKSINVQLSNLKMEDFPKLICYSDMELDFSSLHKEKVIAAAIRVFRGYGWDVSQNSKLVAARTGLIFDLSFGC
ncbi:MAG: hypothetical protein WCV55_02745 [Candidatus Paceibacterota bacterium]